MFSDKIYILNKLIAFSDILIYNINMKNQELNNLKSTLIQLVGNKRYFTSLDSIFDKIDENGLSSNEKQALMFLRADLQSVKNQKDSANKKNRYPSY